jgi:hypothetical protein
LKYQTASEPRARLANAKSVRKAITGFGAEAILQSVSRKTSLIALNMTEILLEIVGLVRLAID